MPKSSKLTSISIDELQSEVRRRQRRLPALRRRRSRLAAKVAVLDAAIAELGGSATPSSKRRGRRGEGTLSAYLQRALKGKILSVAEATAAVKKMGYTSSSPNFRLIVNAALIRKGSGFERVGRGQYTTK